MIVCVSYENFDEKKYKLALTELDVLRGKNSKWLNHARRISLAGMPPSLSNRYVMRIEYGSPWSFQ